MGWGIGVWGDGLGFGGMGWGFGGLGCFGEWAGIWAILGTGDLGDFVNLGGLGKGPNNYFQQLKIIICGSA